MKENVKKIWPEINWIKDEELKTKVLDCWVYAIENSVLTVEDLEVIPFSLLIKILALATQMLGYTFPRPSGNRLLLTSAPVLASRTFKVPLEVTA